MAACTDASNFKRAKCKIFRFIRSHVVIVIIIIGRVIHLGM